MPLMLGFETKYILNPWSISFNLAKVFLMAFAVLFNTISGKVWNDVIRRAWVNLTRKCFRQYKYPKRPHIGHNLFLATYFDIFLAIESKISPKMSLFLMLLAPIWERSKLTFFKPKIIKSSYFEFQKSYIPQRKLKTYEIRIQLEKIRITARNF